MHPAQRPATARAVPPTRPTSTRQQAKIVTAINALDADIVSLEELENSVKFGETDRDDAIADPGRRPQHRRRRRHLGLRPVARRGATCRRCRAGRHPLRLHLQAGHASSLVGPSEILVGTRRPSTTPASRWPRPSSRSAPTRDAFAVIVNHFKSKGAGADRRHRRQRQRRTGSRQAKELVAFANEFAADRDTDKVFLVGDFNAYSTEDPIQVLNDAGYTELESTSDPARRRYNFDGLSGSLDHVFANAAALGDGRPASTSGRSTPTSRSFYKYGRYNTNNTTSSTRRPVRRLGPQPRDHRHRRDRRAERPRTSRSSAATTSTAGCYGSGSDGGAAQLAGAVEAAARGRTRQLGLRRRR